MYNVCVKSSFWLYRLVFDTFVGAICIRISTSAWLVARPGQFCFAVRRTEQHGPEGTVSIEEECHGDTGRV